MHEPILYQHYIIYSGMYWIWRCVFFQNHSKALIYNNEQWTSLEENKICVNNFFYEYKIHLAKDGDGKLIDLTFKSI